MGLGHLWRPPNFTIESTTFVGRFVSELPLAVLTHSTPRMSMAFSHLGFHKKTAQMDGLFMEGQVGLEPTTPCLRGRCSNQLSYWPILMSIMRKHLRKRNIR